MGTMKYVVAVDIGGTHATAGLVSEARSLRKTVNVGIERGSSKRAFLSAVMDSVRSLMSSSVSGIALSCPGPIDRKKGRILNTPNLPIRNTSIKERLEREFSVPVGVENDANCFVLGEALFGRARGYGVVAGLTLGSGVGGGLVVNGELFLGSGNAAEFGKITIDYQGPAERIVNKGGAEEFVSERGLMRIAGRHKAKNPKELYDYARKGDRKAIKAFTEYGRLLGVAVANVAYAADPEAFVLGGGIAKASRFFRKSMMEELRRRVARPPKMFFSTDSRKSALLGAAETMLPDRRVARSIKTVKKPWGSFTRYTLNRKITVKIIEVKRGGKLSLQSHRNRDELWVALDDGIYTEIEGRTRKLSRGERVFVPRNSLHRLWSSRNARVLEVSFGDFDERDIKRYEDIYGRAGRRKGE